MIQFNTNEFAPFYKNYVELSLLNESIVEGMKQQMNELISFYLTLPKEKLDFQYEEGKWTPKDLLLHVIDAERIFSYRALRIARNDATELPGFDENDYVKFANASNRTLESLIQEYKSVREASITLFESFTQEQLICLGFASNCSVSVRAIGYIILGHEKHHLKIIKERYLS